MYVAIGEASRETYVIGETQAEVMRKLFEEYPYVSADKNVYPERREIKHSTKRAPNVCKRTGQILNKKIQNLLTKESISK
ncbi:hypothetical protein QLQ57_09275 [Enterococcus faecalis]|uniref:hypothetical protein n=1 Tax=Enterococcus faecalis TaxID=1351 RepID=UPI0026703D6E|nr:hypothetical protein [Enterococcus faecalis]WHK05387.1 hypothetical protein QLQ57_09275 [Enterococcus faecalis]